MVLEEGIHIEIYSYLNTWTNMWTAKLKLNTCSNIQAPKILSGISVHYQDILATIWTIGGISEQNHIVIMEWSYNYSKTLK